MCSKDTIIFNPRGNHQIIGMYAASMFAWLVARENNLLLDIDILKTFRYTFTNGIKNHK